MLHSLRQNSHFIYHLKQRIHATVLMFLCFCFCCCCCLGSVNNICLHLSTSEKCLNDSNKTWGKWSIVVLALLRSRTQYWAEWKQEWKKASKLKIQREREKNERKRVCERESVRVLHSVKTNKLSSDFNRLPSVHLFFPQLSLHRSIKKLRQDEAMSG